jgi:lysophospholipase L1-like esterase
MHEQSQSERRNRRRFLGYLAGSVAGSFLAACSRGSTPTGALPTPTPGIILAPTPVGTAPVVTPAPPSPSGGSPPLVGVNQSVGTLGTQRVFVAPLDPAWSYSHGPWMRLPHSGWPTDRMVAVLSDAWVRDGQVLRGGVGRRCAIATNSPDATLLAAGDGRAFSVSLDGADPAPIGPLPNDGSRVEVPLFAGRTGTTRIELIFDAGGENDGLFVAAGATVSPIPGSDTPRRRLVVLGNGYAQGVGATAPGVRGCAAQIGELLNVEAVNQGWDGTDVDVRRAEQGNPVQNSGLDRAATDVIALAPSAVLLIYGLDAAVASTIPPWQYAYDYATLLRTIRTALPGVPIFCSGIPSCSTGISELFLRPWNDAVRSATITVDNCSFIDAAGWWGPANYFGGIGPVSVAGDNLHPNDAGYAFLADRYVAALAPHLP